MSDEIIQNPVANADDEGPVRPERFIESDPKASETGTRHDSPYGYCPECGMPGETRERRPNGNDRCGHGHTYPTRDRLLKREEADKVRIKYLKGQNR